MDGAALMSCQPFPYYRRYRYSRLIKLRSDLIQIQPLSPFIFFLQTLPLNKILNYLGFGASRSLSSRFKDSTRSWAFNIRPWVSSTSPFIPYT